MSRRDLLLSISEGIDLTISIEDLKKVLSDPSATYPFLVMSDSIQASSSNVLIPVDEVSLQN